MLVIFRAAQPGRRGQHQRRQQQQRASCAKFRRVNQISILPRQSDPACTSQRLTDCLCRTSLRCRCDDHGGRRFRWSCRPTTRRRGSTDSTTGWRAALVGVDNWEVVYVNDGSTDATLSVIEALHDTDDAGRRRQPVAQFRQGDRGHRRSGPCRRRCRGDHRRRPAGPAGGDPGIGRLLAGWLRHGLRQAAQPDTATPG